MNIWEFGGRNNFDKGKQLKGNDVRGGWKGRKGDRGKGLKGRQAAQATARRLIESAASRLKKESGSHA